MARRPARGGRDSAAPSRRRGGPEGGGRHLRPGGGPPGRHRPAVPGRGRSAIPEERDLALVGEEYAAAVAHARLLPDGDAYTWSWEGTPDDLGRPLWPVARSAVELLTGGDLRRVKECPGAGDCGWLFYDTSRGGARRWCSMEGCGSRVKMRRHYARHRATP